MARVTSISKRNLSSLSLMRSWHHSLLVRPGRPWGPLWPTSSNFDGENDERLDFWVAQCFLIIPDDLACGWRSLELRMRQGKKALALAVPTCQECMMRPEVDERRLPCDWRGLLKVSELAESFKFVERL